MVVDNFHSFRTGASIRPFKTEPPLVVDPDAPQPLAAALQRFEPVFRAGPDRAAPLPRRVDPTCARRYARTPRTPRPCDLGRNPPFSCPRSQRSTRFRVRYYERFQPRRHIRVTSSIMARRHALTNSGRGANAPNIRTASRTNPEQDQEGLSAQSDCTRRSCSTDRYQGTRPHVSKPLPDPRSSESTKGRTGCHRPEPLLGAQHATVRLLRPCPGSEKPSPGKMSPPTGLGGRCGNCVHQLCWVPAKERRRSERWHPPASG